MAFDTSIFENVKKVKFENMRDYVKEVKPEDKAWFKSVAIENVKKKKGIKQFNADGSPVMIQVKDKHKKPKFNEDGTPMMKQAIKYEEVEDSKAKPKLNLLKAKKAFYERYFPTLWKQEDKENLIDSIMDW